MKTEKNARYLFIGILLGGLITLLVMTCITEADKPVPSLSEIQAMVGAEPDGVYGPETKEKWDMAVCERYAAEAFRNVK